VETRYYSELAEVDERTAILTKRYFAGAPKGEVGEVSARRPMRTSASKRRSMIKTAKSS